MSNPKPLQFSGGSRLNNLHQELCLLNLKRQNLIDSNSSYRFFMFEIKPFNSNSTPPDGYQGHSERYAAIQSERKAKFIELVREWMKQVIQKDKPDYVVISIGSNHKSGEQMIPEFVRTDKGRTKYALLNLDMIFDENNPYLVGRNFSNLCVSYHLHKNSEEMALLGECMNELKANNMHVILMSFCEPTFHRNLSNILQEQYPSLGNNFSYVSGYFQDFPVVVVGKNLMEALISDQAKEFHDFFHCYRPKIGLASGQEKILDSKIISSINELSLDDLFPVMRKTHSP